jgi:hypothetical protein
MKGLNGWLRQLESNQSAVLATLLKELENLTIGKKLRDRSWAGHYERCQSHL